MQVAQNLPTIVLKNRTKFFQIIFVFYRRGGICIVGTKNWGTKNWGLGIFDSHTKITKMKNIFCTKCTRKRKKL